MKSRDILEELQSMGDEGAFLSQMKNVNVFEVPEGYFESYQAAFNGELEDDNRYLPTDKTYPLEAPEVGYFEGLSEQVHIKRVEAELQSTFGKEMPYAVSQGYFAESQTRLFERIAKEEANLAQPQKTTKVINVSGWRTMGRTMRLAASILLFLGIGIFWLGRFDAVPMNPAIAMTPSAEQMLNDLSQEDIQTYVRNNMDEFETLLATTYSEFEWIQEDGNEELLEELYF